MSKFIFRVIDGVLTPIRIGSQKGIETTYTKSRVFKATVPGAFGRPRIAGTMHVHFNKLSKKAVATHVIVDRPFRSKGIAGKLYEHALQFTGKTGRSTLRTNQIMNPDILDILAHHKSSLVINRPGRGLRKVGFPEAKKLVSKSSVAVIGTSLTKRKK